jgi:glutamate-1-semialdehyde aminotransferase
VTPHGVPQHLAGSALTWDYGDAESLENLLTAHLNQFAAIVMEPSRDGRAPDGFLEAVRGLADAHGAVLIFDEVCHLRSATLSLRLIVVSLAG